MNKILRRISFFNLAVIIFVTNIITFALKPMYVQASALPTPPPGLELVTPQLRIIRGNAYQYALEKSGYDVQSGFNALQVIGAVESACKVADYAFQNDSDYQATMHHVDDRSGLPDNLQGLNAELYFAKIDYLDMQLGVYLDEFGNMVGDTIVKYKDKIQASMNACISTIKKNVLGEVNISNIGLDSSFVTQNGVTSGIVGTVAYGTYITTDSRYPFIGAYVKITSCDTDSKFFVLEEDRNLPTWLVCISKHVPGALWTGDTNNATIDGFKYDIAHANENDGIFYTYYDYINGRQVASQNGDYYIYYVPLEGWDVGYDYMIGGTHHSQYPFLSLDMTQEEFSAWFKTQYIPNTNPDNLVEGAINLNPNANPEAILDNSYDYDSLADHNRAVTDTKPEIEPSPVPLPDGAPLYPPVSKIETLPKPELAPMPEYQPIPEPSPEPDPSPEPKPESDINLNDLLADLKSVFPFCIPFDLIHAFTVLQADAVAPYWEIPLKAPLFHIDYTFVIDFNKFNSVAQIFRTCEIIGFIIGLILVTRKLIKG